MDPRTIQAIREGRGLPSHASEALEAAYSLQEALEKIAEFEAVGDFEEAFELAARRRFLAEDALMEHGGIPAPEETSKDQSVMNLE